MNFGVAIRVVCPLFVESVWNPAWQLETERQLVLARWHESTIKSSDWELIVENPVSAKNWVPLGSVVGSALGVCVGVDLTRFPELCLFLTLELDGNVGRRKIGSEVKHDSPVDLLARRVVKALELDEKRAESAHTFFTHFLEVVLRCLENFIRNHWLMFKYQTCANKMLSVNKI
jgi:hypothetical protein